MANVAVTIRPEGYAIISLQKEPVNTLNTAFWQELSDTVKGLERDPKVRGVIFSSGLKRDVFTAGNDITELYAPKTSQQQYTKFWVLQNRFMAQLYSSPLVTVAAIRGACPAGGCGIAMCCDVRIMTQSGHIGLNEVALGIRVPYMWCQLMARLVGQATADRLTQFATLLLPADAKKVGLVDEVVPKEELMAAAEKAMVQLLKVPDESRFATKIQLRGGFSQEWEAFCEPEAAGAWAMLESPQVVQAMHSTLQRLSGSKKARAKL